MKDYKVDTQQTLLEAVKHATGFGSTTKARKFIKYGNVMVDGKTITIPGIEVKSGQVVSFGERKKRQTQTKESSFPFKVLYEDAAVIAFNKPSGIPIRSDNPKQTSVMRKISSWMYREDSDEDLFVLNKIDKKESGVLLAVRDMALRTTMENNGWDERFYAVVPGGPKDEDGVKVTNFRRNKIGLLLPVSDAEDVKESEIQWRVMKRNAQYSLLKVTRQTRLKNEVRAQMAAMGHPVIGDKRYKSEINPLYRLGLHVFSLKFEHPVSGEPIEVKTPVPREFLNLLK